MAFTTEELLNLGLTEEQVKSVFVLHGKDVNETKSALDTITQERDSLKSQLQNTE
ncbi:phage scaffolding protein, partial [Streptococcus canis]